jgi:hypothetical protein
VLAPNYFQIINQYHKKDFVILESSDDLVIINKKILVAIKPTKRK